MGGAKYRQDEAHGYAGRIIVGVLMLVQLALVFGMQKTTVVSMDGIFTYTLANNPYTYLFIDGIYDEFPQNNGWIDAHILKENYTVEEYDRYNYSAVYHHQRYDVHPPLYYSLVHTISSLFAGTYSNLYALSINLGALFLLDLLLVKLFQRLYGKAGYGIVPIALLLGMEVMMLLYTLARMYMLLFLFCTWYLYIHAGLLRGGWKKTDLLQMILCILGGTLTHYYFYVYAACLTFMMCMILIYQKRKYELFNYIYSGLVGIAASWIVYPWVLWHIFDNEQGKHTNIKPWSVERVRDYFSFLNDVLFSGRAWAFAIVVVLLCLGAAIAGRRRREQTAIDPVRRTFRRMTIASGLCYSFLVFTLDGSVMYYQTAFYMTFLVWASMLLLDLLGKIWLPQHGDWLIILTAVVCVAAICPVTAVKGYIEHGEDVAKKMYRHQTLQTDFRRMPEEYSEYSDYDCIYIEQEQNALLHNYFFEFGEYREFKKIPLEDFNQYGITEECLDGRSHTDEKIVIYAPLDCFPDEEYRLLASEEDYGIYVYGRMKDAEE